MHGLSGVVERSPYAGIFVLLILGGVGLPLPQDITLILCGLSISTGIIRPVPTLIVVYSGLLIADYFLYSVGRKYGPSIVTHKRFRRILTPERLAMLEDKFNKRGVLIILLGRHVIGVRAQLILITGIMGMPPHKFLAADAVASLFTMAIWLGTGYAGGNSLQAIRRGIIRTEHIVILITILLIVIWLFVRYFKSRRNKA